MFFATEPEILEELLKESPDIVTRRKECVKMVGALNQAEAMYVLQGLGGIDNGVLTSLSSAWTVSRRYKAAFRASWVLTPCSRLEYAICGYVPMMSSIIVSIVVHHLSSQSRPWTVAGKLPARDLLLGRVVPGFAEPPDQFLSRLNSKPVGELHVQSSCNLGPPRLRLS